MADENVNVTVTAASNVPGVAARDVEAFRAYEAQLASLRAAQAQGMTGLEASIERTTSLMNGLRGATGTVASELGGITPAAQALIAALREVGNAGGAIERSRVPIAAMRGEIESTIATTNRWLSTIAASSVSAGPLGVRSAVDVERFARTFRQAESEAAKAAHGIGVAMSGAIVPQTAITRLSNVFNQAQNEGSRAAHGIETAMAGAFASPAILNGFRRSINEVQSLSERAAHGFTTATGVTFLGGSATFRAISRELENIKKSAEEAGAAGMVMGRMMRGGVSLFDEGFRHAHGAMVSTISSMLRDTGALRVAIQTLSGPWGVVAVAGVGALTALGYAAEQAYQRFESISSAAGRLALGGTGDQTQVLTAQFEQLQNRTDEYAGTVKKMQGALAELPPAAQAVTGALAEQATAVAGFTKEDPAKVLDEFTKAAMRGPEALAKFREEVLRFQGATDSQGRTIEEAVRATSGLSAQYEAAAHFGDNFTKSTIEAGNSARKAQTEWFQAGVQAAALGEGAAFASDATTKLQHTLEQITEPGKAAGDALKNLGDAERNQVEIVNATLSAMDKFAAVIGDLRAAEEEYGRAVTQGNQALAERAQRALAIDQARAIDQPLDPGAANEHQRRLTDIEAEAQARREDLGVQAQAAQARVDEEERAQRQKLQQAGASDPEIQAELDKDNKLRELRLQAAEAGRRVQDQQTQIRIAQLRAEAAEEDRGTADRVAKLEQAAALEKGLADAGRASPVAAAEAERAVSAARLQGYRRDYQEFKQAEELKLEAARGNVAAIRQIYAELQTRASGRGVPAGESDRLAREEAQAIERAQAEGFRATQEAINAENKLDDTRLAVAKRSLEQQAASHAITKSQEVSQEQALTASIMAEEERRVEAAAGAADLTLQQKQKLYEQLVELYEKDAEKQLDLQKQLTTQIETENEKRAKSFTQLFDSAGSQLERFITSEVTGQARGRQAFRSLAQGLVGDLLKGTADFASHAAAGPLANMLGVKVGDNAGIGDVLGQGLLKALGLYKEPPKTDQQKIVDLESKAVDAQTKAVSLLEEIAKNTGHSAAGANQGTGTGGQFSSTDVANAAALVRKYESGGNYYAGYSAHGSVDLSNAPLNQYGFPQWSGNMGPQGISHAAGAYQFEPATWAQYAGPMGIHDFSPASQDRVFAAAYGAQGLGPWSSNSRLMAAANSGGMSGSGLPQNTALNSAQQQQVTVTQQQVTATQQQISATQQNQTAIASTTSSQQQQAQAVGQDTNAIDQHSQSTRTASSAVGGTGSSGLIGGVQSLAGQLARVSPVMGAFSSVLGVAQTAVTLFSSATTAAAATSTAKSGLAAIPIIGGLFLRGGIVPSAAGGMIVPSSATAGGGTVSILHPNEMVLPSAESNVIQSMAKANVGGPNFSDLAPAPAPSSTMTNSNMTYAPNITGRFGSISKTEMAAILRSGGDQFESMARNFMRNGALGYNF